MRSTSLGVILLYLLMAGCGSTERSPGLEDILSEEDLARAQSEAQAGDVEALHQVVFHYENLRNSAEVERWENYAIERGVPFFLRARANDISSRVAHDKAAECESANDDLQMALDHAERAYLNADTADDERFAIMAYFEANNLLHRLCVYATTTKQA